MQLRRRHTLLMTGATVPLCPCTAAPTSCPHRLEAIQLRQQAHYYQALHQRACQREAQLRQRLAELEALLRLREQ